MSFRNLHLQQIALGLLSGICASLTAATVLLAFNASTGLGKAFLVPCVLSGLLACIYSMCLYVCRSKTALTAIAIVLMVLSLVGGWVIANPISFSPLADQESNVFLCTLIALAVCTVVVMLSRSRGGSFIFLLLVIGVSCFVELLYQEHHWILYVLTTSAALAYLLSKFYFAKEATVSSANTFVVLESLAMSVIVAAVAYAIFAIVIQPLNPQVLFHPILSTEHISQQEEYARGVGDVSEEPNSNVSSNNYSDAVIKSSTLSDEQTDAFRDSSSLQQKQQEDSMTGGAQANLNTSGTSNLAGNEVLQKNRLPMLLLLIFALLCIIALAIALRLLLRHRRFAAIKHLNPDASCRVAYRMALHNLSVLGYPIICGATILEHASSEYIPEELQQIEDVEFKELAYCYASSVYGAAALESRCAQNCLRYLSGFYKAARQYIGLRHYMVKWWHLK